MERPTDVIVVRGGIVVRRLQLDDLAGVLEVLDAAEATLDAPLVDETERERLETAVGSGRGGWADGWFPLGAFRGATPVGYAAFRVSEASAGAGDATALTADPARAVLGALLAAVRAAAAEAGLQELQVWVRRGGEREVDVAAVEGFRVARRLGVLGRHLDELGDTVEPAGHVIRAYHPDEDDTAVVEILAAAYEGTAEAGWDLARFRERRAMSWFRADDLLVAEDGDGQLGGLHWLKRRDAATGEVYNLAVHPRAQGARLGPALLSAGLHHLRDVGCEQVVLWVDRANERAVRLYERQGFTTRWDDLAFAVEPS